MGNYIPNDVITRDVTPIMLPTEKRTIRNFQFLIDDQDFIRMGQVDKAAKIWYSNILALIKLR